MMSKTRKPTLIPYFELGYRPSLHFARTNSVWSPLLVPGTDRARGWGTVSGLQVFSVYGQKVQTSHILLDCTIFVARIWKNCHLIQLPRQGEG